MSTASKEFKKASVAYTRLSEERSWIRKALKGYEAKRDENMSRFADWQQARNAAAAIKTDAIDHLDSYLDQFISKLRSRGAHVHLAHDAEDARQYICNLAKEKNAKTIVKSKSMTSEEIHLNGALEKNGYKVIESDLGEFIVQLRDEAPYHIVFPSMHLRRGEIRSLFEEKLGSKSDDQPESLTMVAREELRQQYLQADIGITGVNFAIAETGMISITENEGNARLTSSMPKVHLAIMGIEKILPRLEHLALFLPMLATAGAGQHLTGYNTLISGPSREDESDGPEEFHLVILDNQRTTLLSDPEQRDALHCIRCGACLNVCPIFKNIGGHSYGTTYQGPIGSVITPHLKGLPEYKHLSYASSLCGACTEVCPVKIDLHHHLLRSRRNAIRGGKIWWEAILFYGFVFLSTRPSLYTLSSKLGAWAQSLFSPLIGSWIDPVRAWSATRTLPKPPRRTFREYWRSRQP